MHGEKGKVVFKPYDQGQLQMFPPSLDSLIPENHIVRLINCAIDQMDILPIIDGYKGGGTSSYHPRMLLKVVVYAYSQRLYSSRQIAKAVRENVNFMWLSGGNRPDFRTINRFRSSRLRGSTEKIFAAMLKLLSEAGLVDLKEYFLDGTKFEANANRYSFVWKKSTQRHEENLDKKVRQLFREIDRLNRHEDKHYRGRDLPELGEDARPISTEQMEERLAELNKALAEPKEDTDKETRRRLKKAARKLEKDLIPRKKKYQKQQKTFQERNSYSKTDPDATFMRMKEDHMLNGQLKPGYNVQMGTENQFITGYSVHQKSTDTTLFALHLAALENEFCFVPEKLIADAGYGSEENYSILENRDIKGYVKYSGFDGERKRKFSWQKDFYPEFMEYDEKVGAFICPAGKRLNLQGIRERKTTNGFVSLQHVYVSENCDGCELRTCCHNRQGNRKVQVNHKLLEYRKKARKNLRSPQGETLRRRRLVEIESVFGQIKHNGAFRRFMLRGIEKVTVETGLLSLAHNLKKWHRMLQNPTPA
jgi:transposase